jgi:alpha-beta hydrolase superfamily lysophospholipase
MTTPTCTQHEWNAPDGEKFSYSAWGANLKPGQNPRAVVVAVHGLSGAALDYEPLGSYLIQHSVVTFALELRGQGNDPVPERRGDLTTFEEWFSDLRTFLALVRARHPGIPIFYYGESMGAAILTRFVAQAREPDLPAGLVLASPVIAVPGNPSWWRKLIFHFFYYLTPKRRINVAKYTKRVDEDDPKNWVTRDASHRSWVKTAPHRITSFTFRFFKNLFDLMGGCLEAAPKITVPVLVVYAANDVFIPPVRVEQFFARIGSREKELTLFPEAYHLLLHDHDRDQALVRIESWFLEHIR